MGCHGIVIQLVIGRRLGLFGDVSRMKDSRLVRQKVFGLMDGKVRRGRSISEWLDEISDSVHSIYYKAQYGGSGRKLVQRAIDNNRQHTHGV